MAQKTKDQEHDNKTKKVILLDAQAILHRAYHALPDFSSGKGEPTGALYGLSLMLLKIISEFKPQYIVACFDVKAPTYRHEAYQNYKAGRKKTDEELIYQIDKSKKIFEAFGVPFYEKPGFEADDILGTIVEKLKDRGDIEIIIASGDMDTLQLVEGDKVQVYTLKKGIKDTITYNEEEVLNRFGFHPILLPDYKGLRGDPSDNIIGIAGIGEKTATELIKTFGAIENIYKVLKENKEVFTEKGFKNRIIELLLKNEEEALFSKMLATINRDVTIDFILPEELWSADKNKDKILSIFKELEFRSLVERVQSNFSKDVVSNTLPFGNPKEAPLELDFKEVAVACWLLDSNLTNPTLEDILIRGKSKTFNEAREKIFKELKEKNLFSLYEDIEKPLIPVVEGMESRGIKIDKQFLSELSVEYHKKLADLQRRIWVLCEKEFNINSPKQLGQVLFDELNLKLKNQKKTGAGAKSTRESELEKLKNLHPVISLILEYKELQKLLSTYIDNIPTMLQADGRLHAKFNQTGTTTGRMSSENPNMQNIPIKTDMGKKIRNAFIAEDRFVLVAFDYSQIDLRVAAFLSKDEKLIKILKESGDVHTAVASLVFNVRPEEVDYEMRRKAKVINFGIIYGMGVNALKTALNTSREDAQRFLDDYFKNFNTLASYLSNLKIETEKKGYSETFFGRKRYFPAIYSKIPYIKSSAERMAINAPIQGTTADIIKIAMVKVEEYLKSERLTDKVFLTLQIHDELIYEIDDSVSKETILKIKMIMESVMNPKDTQGLRFTVKTEIGKNWGSMTSLEI